MKKLPPYDPNAKCPKCGHDEVRTYYCKTGQPLDSCWLKIEHEHLHRACQRCHYKWLEACLEESDGE